ncbi:U1 small nuclear ribonucleoprotein 70 kDa [Cherax quadricarinatus]
MTQYLPPNLLALFAPRDPIPYLPPVDKLTWEKRTDGYSGLANLIQKFEDPKDTPPPTRVETREERLERKRREKAEQMQYKLEQDSLALGAFFGAMIVMVHNIKTGKPRGYAFIEYEHERDMHSAYKHADGKKIDNRRVLVDVERARTVKGWLSRRLGGGLGGTRRGGPDVNIKHSGREDDRRRGGGRDEERMASNDRERVDRDRGERERRHTRSREREREPRERRRRSRSRDRKRRRSRSRERAVTVPEEGDEREKRRHRSRSRDRKRRSKSRERKHRRERDRDRRERGPGEEGEEGIKIKQEPDDDYPDYSGPYFNNNFALKDEEEQAKNGTKYEEEEEETHNEIDY